LLQYLTQTSSSNHQNYYCQRGRQHKVFVNIATVFNTNIIIKPPTLFFSTRGTTSGLCRNHHQYDYQHHQTTKNILVNEGDNISSLSTVLNTNNTTIPTKPSLSSRLTRSGLCRNHPQCDYQHHQTTKTILVILAINNIMSLSTVFNTNIINNTITILVI